MQKYEVEYQDRSLQISRGAIEVLQPWHWPGNIRELENTVRRVIIISYGMIAVKDLPVFPEYHIGFPEKDFVWLREMEKEYVKRVLLHTWQQDQSGQNSPNGPQYLMLQIELSWRSLSPQPGNFYPILIFPLFKSKALDF